MVGAGAGGNEAAAFGSMTEGSIVPGSTGVGVGAAVVVVVEVPATVPGDGGVDAPPPVEPELICVAPPEELGVETTDRFMEDCEGVVVGCSRATQSKVVSWVMAWLAAMVKPVGVLVATP